MICRTALPLGWSPPHPAVYARERDDAWGQAWLTHDWARMNQRLVAEARNMVFVDETGVSCRAKTGTTGAPRGQTPILRRVSQRRA